MEKNEFIVNAGKLIKYTGNDKKVIIPPGIKIITSAAFTKNTTIEEIECNSDVEVIDEEAFFRCNKLKTVKFYTKWLSVDRSAFEECTNLESVVLCNVKLLGRNAFTDCRNLKSAYITGTYKELPPAVFAGCKKLSTIKLSNDLAVIETCAFKGCDSIVKMPIPKNVKCIKERAFDKCKGLKSIYIADNLSEIRIDAFRYCDNLEEIKVSIHNSYYGAIDNVLISRKTLGITIYPPGKKDKKYVMPKFVRSICTGAFNHNIYLKDIVFSEELRSFSYESFSNCPGITTLHIPLKVTSLPAIAFNDCKNLKNIYIYGKFCKFSGGWIGLMNDWNIVIYKYRSFSLLEPSDKSHVLQCFIKAYIKDKSQFDEEDIKSYLRYIKSSRHTLLKYVDKNNYIFLRILLDEKMLGLNDIDYLLNLEDEILDVEMRTELLLYKEQNCEAVDEFEVFEKEMKIVEDFASEGKLPVAEARKLWSFSKNAAGNYKLTHYKGQDSSVVIPRIIGKTIVDELGVPIFSYNTYVSNVTIPDTITTIDDSAFYGTTLDKITIPSTVKYIGPSSFTDSNLQSVEVLANIEKIERNTFADCGKLKRIILPEGLLSIGYIAFARCYSLKKIEIPDSVEFIDKSAFYNCTSLREIHLPNNLTEICSDTFTECKNLEEIVIPCNVKRIADNSFKDCAKLKKLIITGLNTKVTMHSFAGCHFESVTVPKGYSELYLKSILYCSKDAKVQYIDA